MESVLKKKKIDWFDLAENGEYEKMKEILDRKQIDVDQTNVYGWTALMLAAVNSNTTSNIETVKLLLESGADVNFVFEYRFRKNVSVLMLSAGSSDTTSNIETVELLLKFGANVNLQDNAGWTALMFATKNSNITSNLETIKLLLEYGADPFQKSLENKSALDYCPTKECKKVINKAIWERFYKTDKMVADKLNKRIPLGKDIWEIIMLNKRQQILCQNLSSNKNIEVLVEFALEFGIPMEKIKSMNKAQLCGTISRYLAYGKNTNIEKIEREKGEIIKFAREYAKKFGIDTNQSNEKLLEELAKIL